MNYIVCKNFNQKGIDGNFNLSVGTIINEDNSFLINRNRKICFIFSQNAYDFFARNDDNHGQERFALTTKIKEIISNYVSEYQEEITAINNSDLSDERKAQELTHVIDKSSEAYNKIRNDGMTVHLLKSGDNTFNFDFYNADINVLKYVKALILY